MGARDWTGTPQRLSKDPAWKGGEAPGIASSPPPNPAAIRAQPELGGGLGMRLNPRSLFARSLGTALREAGA